MNLKSAFYSETLIYLLLSLNLFLYLRFPLFDHFYDMIFWLLEAWREFLWFQMFLTLKAGIKDANFENSDWILQYLALRGRVSARQIVTFRVLFGVFLLLFSFIFNKREFWALLLHFTWLFSLNFLLILLIISFLNLCRPIIHSLLTWSQTAPFVQVTPFSVISTF